MAGPNINHLSARNLGEQERDNELGGGGEKLRDSWAEGGAEGGGRKG